MLDEPPLLLEDEKAGQIQGYLLKILLSVCVISLFMFSRCRIMTTSGIAVAAITNGHRLAKSQPGVSTIAKTRTRGKAIEAAIQASEIYRHIKATAAHITKTNAAQIV